MHATIVTCHIRSLHPADLWVVHPSLANDPLLTQYWLAMVWAVSATTSVGTNITPKSQEEAIFSAIMILLGLIMYSVIIGAASSALSKTDAVDEERRATMERVTKYMRGRKVPQFFQRIIKGAPYRRR